jgi:hypothetical protein
VKVSFCCRSYGKFHYGFSVFIETKNMPFPSGDVVQHFSSCGCHTRSIYQNQVLIVCMTQDQLFHTYGQKCSQITKCHKKYNYYYINSVSKDYDDSHWNRTVEDSITPQERQPGQYVA